MYALKFSLDYKSTTWTHYDKIFRFKITCDYNILASPSATHIGKSWLQVYYMNTSQNMSVSNYMWLQYSGFNFSHITTSWLQVNYMLSDKWRNSCNRTRWVCHPPQAFMGIIVLNWRVSPSFPRTSNLPAISVARGLKQLQKWSLSKELWLQEISGRNIQTNLWRHPQTPRKEVDA